MRNIESKYSASRSLRRVAVALSLVLAGCSDSEVPQKFTSVKTGTVPAWTPPLSNRLPAAVTAEPPKLTCEPGQKLSREELTNYLLSQNALNFNYLGDPKVLQADLLNPEKTTSKLIDVLGKVTIFGFCHDAPFDILILNTGHPSQTTSGNISQHVVGQAFDLRPRQITEGFSQPHVADSLDPQLTDQNEARRRTVTIGDFLLSDAMRPDIHQMIVVGFNPNWNKGDYRDYNTWPDDVKYYHHDHIHIGVEPD